MTSVNKNVDPAFRIQDVTARVAGVELKTTVRVLRALHEVATELGEHNMVSTLERYYIQGADGAGMHDKPQGHHVIACSVVYEGIRKRIGTSGLKSLHALDYCPFMDKRFDSRQDATEQA